MMCASASEGWSLLLKNNDLFGNYALGPVLDGRHFGPLNGCKLNLMPPALHKIRLIGAASLLSFALAGYAYANPTAPTVVVGSAPSNNNSGSTPNVIINWGGFSIAANDLTRFIQPSSLSTALNRIVGGNPSLILGVLQSNGKVLLLNANGVVFSNTGQINLATHVANSLVVSGKSAVTPLNFNANPGAVSAFSTAAAEHGERIYMAGDVRHVTVQPDGGVTLAAGRTIELVDPATPNLRVQVAAPADRARDLVPIAAAADRSGIHAGLIREGSVFNADRVVNGPNGTLMLKAGGESLPASSRLAAAP